jgi:carbon storage regulator
MLVLSRKRGEQIVVPECGLTLTVLDIVGGRVRVGIAAPSDLTIQRAEIVERKRRKSLAPQDK